MESTTGESKTYPIGVVARQLGVSEATLRMYERYGLILVRKTNGNQRLYSESDIERLRCIRTAIVKHKISIEGIRRIQSMVPCWDTIRCPMEQRLTCPAYTGSEAGCWTCHDKSSVCSEHDCLHCRVYLLAGDCAKIKSLVHHHPDLLTGTSGLSMEIENR
jgi:MerR family transcriptional regulator/heat shock protein HspR